MYFCYIDESGTPEIPGTTSHFVLAGLAIPSNDWKNYETAVEKIKSKYDLGNVEIHTGWIVRKYLEQSKIKNFDKLDYKKRRSEVIRIRNQNIYEINKRIKDSKKIKQTKKSYNQTKDYIHLTYKERLTFIDEIATLIGSWENVRLFAECIDKNFWNPDKATTSIDEQAFEQVVSRYEKFLVKRPNGEKGIVIYDNNETVAKKHTELMKYFHKKGTIWTKITSIIETPFFVNSELTSMIQLVDVCSFSIRRYLENNEDYLFNKIFQRVDKYSGFTVGMRHFSKKDCSCNICNTHKY